MRFNSFFCGCLALPKTLGKEKFGPDPQKPLQSLEDSEPTSAKVDCTDSGDIDSTSSVIKTSLNSLSTNGCGHGRLTSGQGYLYTVASNPRTSSSRALVGGVEYNSFFVNPLAEGCHEDGVPIAYAGASIATLEKGLPNPLAEEFGSGYATPPESPYRRRCPSSQGGGSDHAAPAAPGTPSRVSSAFNTIYNPPCLTCHQPWKNMAQSFSTADGVEPISQKPQACTPQACVPTSEPAQDQEQQPEKVQQQAPHGLLQQHLSAALERAAQQQQQQQQEKADSEANDSKAVDNDSGCVTCDAAGAIAGLPAADARMQEQDTGSLPSTPTLQPTPRSSARDCPVLEATPLLPYQKPISYQALPSLPCELTASTPREQVPALGSQRQPAGPGMAAANKLSREAFAPCTPPLAVRDTAAAVASPMAMSPHDAGLEITATSMEVHGEEDQQDQHQQQQQPGEEASEDAKQAEKWGSEEEQQQLAEAPSAQVSEELCGKQTGGLVACEQVPETQPRPLPAAAPAVEAAGQQEVDADFARRCLYDAMLQQAVSHESGSTSGPGSAGDSQGPPSKPEESLVEVVLSSGHAAAAQQQQQQQHPQQAQDPQQEQSQQLQPLPAMPSGQTAAGVLECPPVVEGAFVVAPLPCANSPCTSRDTARSDISGHGASKAFPDSVTAEAPVGGVAVKQQYGVSTGGAGFPRAKPGSFGGALQRVRAPLSTPGAPLQQQDEDANCSISGLAMTRVLIRQLGLLPGPQMAARGTAVDWGSEVPATPRERCYEAAPSPFATARRAAAAALGQQQQPMVMEEAVATAMAAYREQQLQLLRKLERERVQRDGGRGVFGLCETPRDYLDAEDACIHVPDGGKWVGVSCGGGYGAQAVVEEGEEGQEEDGDGDLWDDSRSSSGSSSCCSSILGADGEGDGRPPLVLSMRSIQGWREPQGWKPLREKYGGGVVVVA